MVSRVLRSRKPINGLKPPLAVGSVKGWNFCLEIGSARLGRLYAILSAKICIRQNPEKIDQKAARNFSLPRGKSIERTLVKREIICRQRLATAVCLFPRELSRGNHLSFFGRRTRTGQPFKQYAAGARL